MGAAVADGSSPQVPQELLARYHAELISLLPESEREKYRVKLGAALLQPFIDRFSGQQLTPEQLQPLLEAFLRDELQITDAARVILDGEELHVEISGCHLCHGNELLRGRGGHGFCPYAPGVNRAVSRTLGRGSQLQEVDKSAGVVGQCALRYRIS